MVIWILLTLLLNSPKKVCFLLGEPSIMFLVIVINSNNKCLTPTGEQLKNIIILQLNPVITPKSVHI